MSELKVIKAYLPTFDADPNDMLLVSHTKENYVSAKQIECYLKSEADKVIAEKDAKIAELKAYKPIQPIELLKPRIMKNGCEYYLAGEVRMCIEQAARQIAESNSVYKELDTIIKHQKYKRCLARAKACKEKGERMYCEAHTAKSLNEILGKEPNDAVVEKFELWGAIACTHCKRWLELAEKFKEAK